MDDRSGYGPRSTGRAATLLFAAAAAACLPATTASAGTDPGPALICLHDGIEPSRTARLIEEALGVLEQSGHDPTAYRLELRMEDVQSPDAPTIGADRVPSVVFVPARLGELYPLRVHPASPCVTSWVWQPGRFTAWQREVLARAREQIGAFPHDAAAPNDLWVLETREFVRIEVRQGERAVSVTLSKRGLDLVDRVRGEATPGG